MAKSYEQKFPSLESAAVRLAALMVDAVMADGNADLLPDGEVCDCGVGDEDALMGGKLRPKVHFKTCAGAPENSPALRPPRAAIEWHAKYREELARYPVLRSLMITQASRMHNGVDPIYDWAGLKPAEADAVAMHHTGFQLDSIAKSLERPDTAVRQLIVNGVWKLERALWLAATQLSGTPHCDICAEARRLLSNSPRLQKRLANF